MLSFRLLFRCLCLWDWRLGLVVFSLLFLVSGKTFITGSPLGNESEIILIGTGWLAALLFGTLSMPN